MSSIRLVRSANKFSEAFIHQVNALCSGDVGNPALAVGDLHLAMQGVLYPKRMTYDYGPHHQSEEVLQAMKDYIRPERIPKIVKNPTAEHHHDYPEQVDLEEAVSFAEMFYVGK